MRHAGWCSSPRTTELLGSAATARVCAAHGWTAFSDKSWPSYERIPGLVMQGHTVLVREALAAMPKVPTHVFVRADAAAVAGSVGDGEIR